MATYTMCPWNVHIFFIADCFDMVLSCDLFTLVLQGCFTGTGTTVWLIALNIEVNMDEISGYQITTKNNKCGCCAQFLLLWHHNECDGISNHQPHDCLLNCLFRCRSKKTWNFTSLSLCAGNSPVTGEFPAQRASNAENVSIWWPHHAWDVLCSGLLYIMSILLRWNIMNDIALCGKSV